MVWIIFGWISKNLSLWFLIFWFFSVLPLPEGPKLAVFSDWAAAPRNKTAKNEKFKNPIFRYTPKDHACQFLYKSDHFPETRVKFSLKKQLFEQMDAKVKIGHFVHFQVIKCMKNQKNSKHAYSNDIIVIPPLNYIESKWKIQFWHILFHIFGHFVVILVKFPI